MWVARISLALAILSGVPILLFALDILAWTFGIVILPPLDALLRLAIWSAPLALSLYLPRRYKPKQGVPK